MSTYYINEAVFDLPFEGFRDRSVTLLETKLDSGGEISFGVQRGEYDKGQTLIAMVDHHVDRAARALRAHSVVWREDREVQGLTAIEIACRWRNGKNMIYTRQTFVDVRAAWMLLSVSGLVADRAAIDVTSERTIATLRFRD